MNQHQNASKSLVALFLFLLLATALLRSAPLFAYAQSGPNTPSTTTDELAFAGDISGSDLLTGLTGTGGTWNANGSSPNFLNDGKNGGDFNAIALDALDGAAWAADGTASFREFNLGPGSNGMGFNITRIQSIAAWTGAGFQNQKYQIYVSVVGNPNFTLLTTVEHQPAAWLSSDATSSKGGATKVNVTDTTGILATGVDAIRFNILDTVSPNNGGVVMREIDVFGGPTPDMLPPRLNTQTSVTPPDGASNVLVGSNLVATFSEDIVRGTGNIIIKNLDTPSDITIPIGSAQITINGAVLTINPSSNLALATNYAVLIESTAIKDLTNTPYSGIDDVTAWNFTTAAPDNTAPTITSQSPADGARAALIYSNLVATFTENIAMGTGTINIRNLDNLSDTTITLPNSQVTVTGANLIINPSSDLVATTRYAVRISPGAITDISGNAFTGISNDKTWNFVTAAVPLRIVPMGDSITAGYTDNPTWANHPFKFGYRSGLYTHLKNARYNFRFLGGSAEPWNLLYGDPSYGGTYKPTLDLRDLGQDGHRGYGGKTASYLNANIATWLATDNPDIILLKIGTNQQNQTDLQTLVNTITTTKPNCHLIIAQIMPKTPYQQGIVDYNTWIRNTLVPAQQSMGRKVKMVDQYAPFLTNPAVLTSIDTSLFSNNNNHPDSDGYDKMAQVWFTAIDSLGLEPYTYSKWLDEFPEIDTYTALDDDPDGDGNLNGIESYFGTAPDEFSPSITITAVDPALQTFTFTHPQGALIVDLIAAYQWSKDLVTFHNELGTDTGTTVEFTIQENTPALGTTTVTATATGTPCDKLFLRLKVTQEE